MGCCPNPYPTPRKARRGSFDIHPIEECRNKQPKSDIGRIINKSPSTPKLERNKLPLGLQECDHPNLKIKH